MLIKYLDLAQINIENGPWIAGGCARKLWFGEDWKNGDIDLFFQNHEVFKEYSERMNSLPEITIDNLRLKPRLQIETKQAITYVMDDVDSMKPVSNFCDLVPKRSIGDKYTIQLINRNFYQTLDDVFSDFDLTVCKFATDGKTIVASEDAVDDCIRKSLVLNSTQSRNTSKLNPKRIIKYMMLYGFEATSPIMSEMIRQHQSGEIHDADEYA